ncbi:MAG TPA: PhzF family phenazine biosynthesis protein [Candidatus Eisenbacteria bacterium]|nr:PhzF family phenazine biosynthesis protein [Candidatus Eisenbacteria bacterium]
MEPGNIAHGRYFAPSFGVREDPVTGSASGPLGVRVGGVAVTVLEGQLRLD